MLPTGTYRTLTTGKFSMGPMAAAFHMGKRWIIGGVAQQWWSVAGDAHRSQVNLTDVQYVVKFRVTPTTNIGCAPNIRINWVADGKDRVT